MIRVIGVVFSKKYRNFTEKSKLYPFPPNFDSHHFHEIFRSMKIEYKIKTRENPNGKLEILSIFPALFSRDFPIDENWTQNPFTSKLKLSKLEMTNFIP